MPFIMMLLGKYVLGEEVGLRRILASVVGFIGTLLVIQPSFTEVGLPALWPLAVAVLFSFFILTTRQIAHKIDPVALQAVSGVMACLFILPALLVGQYFELEPLTLLAPNAMEWTLLLSIGVLGTGAHLLMTWALRYAPAATLAPMQYLEIPIATGIGWLVFRDLPNNLAALGICITMCAGLYVIMREQAIAQAKARQAPADHGERIAWITMSRAARGTITNIPGLVHLQQKSPRSPGSRCQSFDPAQRRCRQSATLIHFRMPRHWQHWKQRHNIPL